MSPSLNVIKTLCMLCLQWHLLVWQSAAFCENHLGRAQLNPQFQFRDFSLHSFDTVQQCVGQTDAQAIA